MKTLLELGSILKILHTQKQFGWDQAFVRGGTEIVSVTLELLPPFYVTFVASLNACANRDVLEEGRFAHKQIVETGWDSFMWSFADVLVSSMHHQALQQRLLQMSMNTHLLDDKQLLAFLWTLKSVQWSIHILFHYLMEVASFILFYLQLFTIVATREFVGCLLCFILFIVSWSFVLCFVFLLWNSLWLVVNLLWPHIHAFSLYLIPFSYMPCLFFRCKPSLFSRISFLSFWLGIIDLYCNMARKYPFSKTLWVQHTIIVGLTISTSGYNRLFTKLRLFLRFVEGVMDIAGKWCFSLGMVARFEPAIWDQGSWIY